jgi:hypothetical protein
MMALRALTSISMFYLLLGSCSRESWVGALPSAKSKACGASILALCKGNARSLRTSGEKPYPLIGRHVSYSLRGGENKYMYSACIVFAWQETSTHSGFLHILQMDLSNECESTQKYRNVLAKILDIYANPLAQEVFFSHRHMEMRNISCEAEKLMRDTFVQGPKWAMNS